MSQTAATRTFRGAALVIAVAIADDAFVHPERGTAAGDHLVAGLVPLAVLAVAVLAYPRLPAGAGAAAAVVCGCLAVVAGVADGVRPLAIGATGGDDLTAVLAALAGVVLIGLGAVTAWRSRRRGGTRLRRWSRRGAEALAALVVGLLVVLPVAVAIVATHVARSPVAAADLGRPYERVSIPAAGGRRLAGWYVPSRNGAAVLAFPGRSGPVPQARMLARHGYGVLLIDRGGEGESDGTLNLYGWNGEADVRAALAFLDARPDVRPGGIGGLGLSVGGELLLQAAAGDPRLRAVVSEGAGVRSLAEHLHTPGAGTVGAWISPWVVQTAALAVLSDRLPPPDLADVVARIAPRPVLLIRALHGNADEVLNRVYLARAGAHATLWELDRGGHTGAAAAAPAAYEARVTGFFDRALLGR